MGKKSFPLGKVMQVLSSIVGSAFRNLLHFSDTVHHLSVFTALGNFGQETLKHETKQALIFFLITFFPLLLDSSSLVSYSKEERMDDTWGQVTKQHRYWLVFYYYFKIYVALMYWRCYFKNCINVLANLLLAHETAEFQPRQI